MATNSRGSSSARTYDPETLDQFDVLKSELYSILGEMRLSEESPPNPEQWRELLTRLNTRCDELASLRTKTAQFERGWSSFENLFRTSPVPMMEQDYTEVERWMDQLRHEGVDHITDVLGPEMDVIRKAAAMIRIVAANPAAVEAVGLPIEQLIGPIDPIIVNRGARPSWINQLSAVWERRAVSHASFVAATAAGEEFDAEGILSAPLVDDEPDFSRAVFSLIDITPHRDEERRMAKLMEAKNRFLASVSHEVRTPLTAILGFSRVIEEESGLTQDDFRLMNSLIAQHAQEMSNLIEDLLVAARADMQQLDIVDVRIDVVAEIDNTVRAGGSFTTDVAIMTETPDPYAQGDPGRVRQILRNLLTNAERYGGETVTVTVSRGDGLVFIDVADSGGGLAAEDWERIFQPYESAHERAGHPGAVGIGLTISRQLAELMKGSLDYLQHEEMSIFRLTLRAAG